MQKIAPGEVRECSNILLLKAVSFVWVLEASPKRDRGTGGRENGLRNFECSLPPWGGYGECNSRKYKAKKVKIV